MFHGRGGLWIKRGRLTQEQARWQQD